MNSFEKCPLENEFGTKCKRSIICVALQFQFAVMSDPVHYIQQDWKDCLSETNGSQQLDIMSLLFSVFNSTSLLLESLFSLIEPVQILIEHLFLNIQHNLYFNEALQAL